MNRVGILYKSSKSMEIGGRKNTDKREAEDAADERVVRCYQLNKGIIKNEGMRNAAAQERYSLRAKREFQLF